MKDASLAQTLPAFPPGPSPFTGGPVVIISLPSGSAPEPVGPLKLQKKLWLQWAYSGGESIPLVDCWIHSAI